MLLVSSSFKSSAVEQSRFAFAQDGFDVCVNDVEANAGGIDDTVNKIRTLSRSAHPAPVDITSAPAVDALVSTTVSTLGPLSVMVAIAGIVQAKPLVDTSNEEHQRIFDVNYFGVNNCYRAAARQMIRQGLPPSRLGGSAGVYKIIGAASVAARRPFPLIGAYSASKWAVRGLTHAYASELGHHNITVNSYAPGIVGTPMWEHLDAEAGAYFGREKGETMAAEAKAITMGRVSVPEDVSGVVGWLAGAGSDYVTGQMVVCDGGMVFS